MASDQQPLQRATSPEYVGEKPKQPCCNRYCCYKVFVFVYAVFFLIIGLILMGMGIYLLHLKGEIEGVNSSLLAPGIIGLVVGLIMIFTSICGILGTVKENLILLKIFLAVIIVVFLIQLICGIVAFVKREEVRHIVTDQLSNAIEAYTEASGVKTGVDYIQSRYDCCGVGGYADWQDNPDYKCGSKTDLDCSLPPSCCPQDKRDDEECGLHARKNFTSKAAISKAGYSVEGCYIHFRVMVESNLDTIGALALAFALLHIIGCFFVYLFITKVEDRIFLYKYREHYRPQYY